MLGFALCGLGMLDCMVLRLHVGPQNTHAHFALCLELWHVLCGCWAWRSCNHLVISLASEHSLQYSGHSQILYLEFSSPFGLRLGLGIVLFFFIISHGRDPFVAHCAVVFLGLRLCCCACLGGWCMVVVPGRAVNPGWLAVGFFVFWGPLLSGCLGSV